MSLFRETVRPVTWNLLSGLMEIPDLGPFALVGGTNLSLRFGHRISKDLDLFTNMLSYYQQKYQQSDMGHIILSMTYFEDVEKEVVNPIDLKGNTWEKVKDKMREAVLDFMKK